MTKREVKSKSKISKSYRRKIYHLCKKTLKGNRTAEKKLMHEWDSSPEAKGIIKFWFNKKRVVAEVKRNNKLTLSPEQQTRKDRVQFRGFDDGASVPGSHIRKIDK